MKKVKKYINYQLNLAQSLLKGLPAVGRDVELKSYRVFFREEALMDDDKI